ncbi:MAG TPA: transporter [Methylocystis sp.]|nr:transporter [Methylocystis sp.]
MSGPDECKSTPPEGRSQRFLRSFAHAAPVAFATLALLGTAPRARADESGTSFWQPGAYDDRAAIPNSPGWSVSATPYHSTVYASSSVSTATLVRTGRLNQNAVGDVSATSANFENIFTLSPSYGFALPDLGAQAAVSVSTVVGKASTTESGALAASLGTNGVATNFSFGDSISGFGDLAPQLSLYWTRGVNNFMVYATGNAPVGEYSQRRLANLGIGHGAVDGGLGYTYSNSDAKLEFSAVAGFTYNQINPFTNYRSGVDFHLDVGASTSLNERLSVGPVGYLYDEIGCDGGSGDHFGCFRSRVAGLGARAAYNVALSDAQASFSLKAYGEFAADNRPAGWNLRLAVSISRK